jgi:uncharacterized secreted protein with C-terminal beta-propeller domain
VRSAEEIARAIDGKVKQTGDLLIEAAKLRREFTRLSRIIQKYIDHSYNDEEELSQWLLQQRIEHQTAIEQVEESIGKAMKLKLETEKKRDPSATHAEIEYVETLTELAYVKVEAHIKYLKAANKRLCNKIKESGLSSH